MLTEPLTCDITHVGLSWYLYPLKITDRCVMIAFHCFTDFHLRTGLFQTRYKYISVKHILHAIRLLIIRMNGSVRACLSVSNLWQDDVRSESNCHTHRVYEVLADIVEATYDMVANRQDQIFVPFRCITELTERSWVPSR